MNHLFENQKDEKYFRANKKIINMNKEIKIAVAGTGYVGLSIATLLAQHHPVTAVDVIQRRWILSTVRNHRFKMSISSDISLRKI